MAPTAVLPAHDPPPQAVTAAATAPTPTQPESAPDHPTKRRKRNATAPTTDPDDLKTDKIHILHQSTFRNPQWSYLHLRLLTPDVPSTAPPTSTSTPTPIPPSLSTTTHTADLDPLTTSSLLTTALTAHLGQTGAAIPIDILHIQYRDVWIRIPRPDMRAVRVGLSAWVGACEGGNVPGWKGEGRVRVAWRVVGEGMRIGERDGGGFV